MSSSHPAFGPPSRFEQLRYGRDVLRLEGQALVALSERLSLDDFCGAVEVILGCTGRVVVSGMGKAGLVGRKISATLSSTGTPSQFLHPAEAVHGDLGAIRDEDVALVLSYSGETEEVNRLLPSLEELAIPIVAVTGNPASTLGRSATAILDLGGLQEVCSLGLAPSTSTTAMLAVGDALALTVSRARGFGPEDFVRFHPGGSLGRKLTRVEEVMRPLAECRMALHARSVREVIVSQSRPGRRTGAIMLVDELGRLSGIFTDSDLARLVAQTRDAELDRPIVHVMTRQPKTIVRGAAVEEALQILDEYRISELPVVDDEHRPLGLIDVTDMIGLSSGRRAAAQTLPFPDKAARSSSR